MKDISHRWPCLPGWEGSSCTSAAAPLTLTRFLLMHNYWSALRQLKVKTNLRYVLICILVSICSVPPLCTVWCHKFALRRLLEIRLWCGPSVSNMNHSFFNDFTAIVALLERRWSPRLVLVCHLFCMRTLLVSVLVLPASPFWHVGHDSCAVRCAHSVWFGVKQRLSQKQKRAN